MNTRRTMLIASAPFLLDACSDSPTEPRDEGVECGPEVSSIATTVSPGLAPTFQWNPRCRVAQLAVLDGENGMWALFSGPGENRIVPPVAYGAATPPLVGDHPVPLESSHMYRLVIWIAEADSLRQIESHSFRTP